MAAPSNTSTKVPSKVQVITPLPTARNIAVAMADFVNDRSEVVKQGQVEVSPAPERSGPMAHFRNLFGSRAILAWTDWTALNDSNCAVNVVMVTDRETLNGCQTAWYLNGGVAAEWRDQDARRMLVGEAAQRITSVPDGPDTLDVSHVFPALSVGGGKVMLLDGNHRAAALAASPHDVHVLLMVLEGPRDHLVFPDLVHETHGTDSPSDWHDCVSAIDNKFGDPAEAIELNEAA